VVALETVVTAAIGGAASGAASETVVQVIKAKFDAWWAKEKSVNKNSSADISNLDSSNDSDESSIDSEHQTMVKIVQFFSHELEKLQHDHAAEIGAKDAQIGTLINSNGAKDAQISAKDGQINTLINSNAALVSALVSNNNAALNAALNTALNNNAALISINAALNAALISNNATLNAALISNNTALIKNRPGWFRRVNTGNARAPVGTTENAAEDA
jgi:hypothetical protein